MDQSITAGKETGVSVGHAALTMAVGIIVDRIAGLKAEDRQDLFELVKGLSTATCDDDVEAIRVAMREILDQAPSSVLAMDLAEEAVRPAKLRKWIHLVAGRVQWLRRKKGLTQTELAEKTGLPQSHISRIESGRLSPSRVTLEKLAAALDVPLSQLDPSA
jgi:DNA-binding XRE family transcriptional regulator